MGETASAPTTTTRTRDVDCWPCRLTGGGVMLGVSGYLLYEIQQVRRNARTLPVSQYPRLHVGMMGAMSLEPKMALMRAALFRTTGASSVLECVANNAAKPVPGKGQLLVRNQFIGINFIDTYHRTGLYKVPLPYIPGREASGVVEAIGDGVKGFTVGDRVAYMAANCCAEYALATEDQTIVVPENVSMEEAAALLLQGATAMSLARLVYEVKKGDHVLIHAAAGGTGQLLVQVCKQYGAIVIGTTSSPEKAETAKKAGADHVLLYTQQDVPAEVMKITGGKGVQVVYDGIGKSTFDISLACLARLGTMASFGNASGKVADIDIMKLVPNAVKLMRPSLFQFIKDRSDFEFLVQPLMDLFNQGKLKIHIHKVYALDDIKSAHDDLEGGKTQGKLILRV
ncbi:hypothetical protein HDU80_003062 [Chytriomyces hyalinus]|nr:hypothetical protein HDU80_003062 [Chytriomyces hyalinus]